MALCHVAQMRSGPVRHNGDDSSHTGQHSPSGGFSSTFLASGLTGGVYRYIDGNHHNGNHAFLHVQGANRSILPVSHPRHTASSAHRLPQYDPNLPEGHMVYSPYTAHHHNGRELPNGAQNHSHVGIGTPGAARPTETYMSSAPGSNNLQYQQQPSNVVRSPTPSYVGTDSPPPPQAAPMIPYNNKYIVDAKSVTMGGSFLTFRMPAVAMTLSENAEGLRTVKNEAEEEGSSETPTACTPPASKRQKLPPKVSRVESEPIHTTFTFENVFAVNQLFLKYNKLLQDGDCKTYYASTAGRSTSAFQDLIDLLRILNVGIEWTTTDGVMALFAPTSIMQFNRVQCPVHTFLNMMSPDSTVLIFFSPKPTAS